MTDLITRSFETQIAGESYKVLLMLSSFDGRISTYYSVHRTNTGWASLPKKARIIASKLEWKLAAELKAARAELATLKVAA